MPTFDEMKGDELGPDESEWAALMLFNSYIRPKSPILGQTNVGLAFSLLLHFSQLSMLI